MANIEQVLETFKKNYFEPNKDNEDKIPNSPGNYILCLRKGSKLPEISVLPVMEKFENLEVIYAGNTSKSLRTRDFRQHFTGNNAGRSTLRKSLGVLFGYKLIPRDKDPHTGKTKFNDKDELKLTNWMRENLILFFAPSLNYIENEQELITYFNPPINLQKVTSEINYDFRRLLSQLRKNQLK
ncbi:MAG: hypothetical protein M9887_10820 [Chitinophagales bacterium]|nr:hypothetical protein [Chitinophagales bacterium]